MSKNLSSATFSAEFLAGLALLESLYGPPTGPSGPAPAPASRSRSRASAEGSPTTGTCGPPGSVSSASAALQSAWANRLRARLTGSPECEVIWREWVTPWGQCLSKPRARVRRNIGIVIGLWPTVSTKDHKSDGPKTMAEISNALEEGRPIRQSAQRLRNFVKMALWPAATYNAKPTPDYNEAGNSAGQVVQRKILMGLWPSNRSSPNENRNTRSAPTHGKGHGLTVAGLVQDIRLSMWSALRSTDGAQGGPNQSFGAGGSPPQSPPSPTALSSSSAQTASGAGSLHPEFAGWEMGYSPAWLDSAPSEMPSTRRSPLK